MAFSVNNLQLAPDAAIDLQLHTTYSDGSWTPSDLFDHLLSEQFSLAAITDHDRVDTISTIQRLASDKHLPVLVAVEMTSEWRGQLTDLLCFGFDPDQNALHNLAQNLLHRQQENTRDVYDNLLKQGYYLSDDILTALLAKPSSQQPHAIVDHLMEYDNNLTKTAAGKIVASSGCTLETNDPVAIVDATHQSGGVCLLAHPGRTDGFMTYTAELLEQFRQEIPIDGLEVYYPLHTPSQTAMHEQYAKRHQLLTSSGSDSHGPDKPPIKYRAELSRNLLERLGVQVD